MYSIRGGVTIKSFVDRRREREDGRGQPSAISLRPSALSLQELHESIRAILKAEG